MKYLALAAMLALCQANDYGFEDGDEEATGTEITIEAAETEQEEEAEEEVQSVNETYNYNADTGISVMTKEVDDYFEFAMVYKGDAELEAGVIPDCSLGSPCGEAGDETVCCYRVDMQKNDMYETSYRCMNEVISHADINF